MIKWVFFGVWIVPFSTAEEAALLIFAQREQVGTVKTRREPPRQGGEPALPCAPHRCTRISVRGAGRLVLAPFGKSPPTKAGGRPAE